MEPAGRLAAQLWISEEGSPVAALSSLMVLTGRIGDEEVVAAGGDKDDVDDDVTGEDVVGGSREGFAAVATKLPSSRRDRLNPGSYEVDPEIFWRKIPYEYFALFYCHSGIKWQIWQTETAVFQRQQKQ